MSETIKARLTRELIALRVVKELREGMYVNLGFGLPTLVGNFLPPGAEIMLHSEQGILGYGPVVQDPDRWDIDLVNASAQPVSLVPGGSFSDFVTSFIMIRGGHIDITVLGAYQVSEFGDLANWQVQGETVGGMGGAMELAVGAKKVIVAMEHTTKNLQPRIVRACNYPLTAKRCVNLIVTDVAVIEITAEGLLLKEVAPGWSTSDVQAITEPKLLISETIKEIDL